MISGNSAELHGGGLALCDGTIQNNIICGNSATGENGKGGGLYDCRGLILKNTITASSAGEEGGGVWRCDGTIANCIIWGNTAGQPEYDQVFAGSSARYSCIEDWTGGGIGNITDDPLFADAANGDFHLQAASPCINGGGNYYWAVWPQRDMDTNCRLEGNTVDMGCYEHSSSPDSDGDLLSDDDESTHSTNPYLEDSDGDGLRDGLEILRGSNPVIGSSPTIINIPAGVPTIQQALCQGIDGDQIVVAPGAYQVNLVFCGADVVLRSSDPQDPDVVASTVLDGGGIGRVVAFSGLEGESCVLSGFTIQNGVAYQGAGIRGDLCTAIGRLSSWDSATRATVKNNFITGNTAAQDGGAVAFCKGTIQDNVITDNHAHHGGAAAFCHGTIQDNAITDNRSDRYGGGLGHCDGDIQGNLIEGNRAQLGVTQTDTCGGGLYGCDGTIRDNTIRGNHAILGGGLYGANALIQGNVVTNNLSAGLYSCDGTIQDNIITDNSGSGLALCDGTIRNNIITGNSGPGGGGLRDCTGTIRNNLIAGNTGTDRGGGLYSCDAVIENNTIVGNTAEQRGGGLAICDAMIQNCIIWANTAPSGPQLDNSDTPMYSCIQDWTGGGDGNISSDPRFAEADGPDDDPATYDDNGYRLSALRLISPCIDAGKNEPWMTYALDLDGKRRIFCGRPPCTRGNVRVDMGAYEHGSYPFEVVNLGMLPGMILLEWISQEEETYGVFSCSSLSPRASWTHVATVRSGGETTSWTDRDATSPQKFYRIEISY